MFLIKIVASFSSNVAIVCVNYDDQNRFEFSVYVLNTKTQAYCDLTKLYDQVEAAEQKNDTNLEALTKQANALVDKLGPEYLKMAEGLEQVDLTSSEGKELLSILLELDKLCTR